MSADKKKKVYLAGKLTGDMAQLTMLYGSAKKFLENEGFEVVNPMEIIFSDKPLAELNQSEGPVIYRHLMSQLLISDTVVLIPGYDFVESIEKDLCDIFHIPVQPFNYYLKVNKTAKMRDKTLKKHEEIRKLYKEYSDKKMYRFDWIVKQIADKFFLSESYVIKILWSSEPDASTKN